MSLKSSHFNFFKYCYTKDQDPLAVLHLDIQLSMIDLYFQAVVFLGLNKN